jgi:two-component system, chemotaxis family, protein-glutamate methylesterase/glutaminase
VTATRPEAVVIGASAGALDALSTILPALPAAYALPVMVVVHLPPDKHSILVDLLQTKCAIRIREAGDKEPILAGNVYLAPPDYHLLVETGRTLALSSGEPVLYSRPSIDVLFETAADAYGAGLIGIVLTGANKDGAKGLKAIGTAGGTAIVQDPLSASASAMPQAAIDAWPDARVLSLEQITVYLRETGGCT